MAELGEQLALFDLTPRDKGRERAPCKKAGIRRLSLERFKAFETFEVDFDSVTLLVGGNSSGKTSVLQAIRLFFWCLQQCGRVHQDTVELKKFVQPFGDFSLIPGHELRELVYRGVTPNNRNRGIRLQAELANGRELAFRIYNAYSILMSVEPIAPSPQRLDLSEFKDLNHRPLYIPGFFGVVTQEFLATDARLEDLLSSGHHNELLRNIVLRLRRDPQRFERLGEILETEFGVKALDVPFSFAETDFLRANYSESQNRISLDVVSAGSGFLQVLQILAHALQNPSPILLLDEPDAHMHSALQRSFLTLLRSFAEANEVQVIMASHSETFLREMSLEEIRVIDASRASASRFENAALLEEELSEAGIWPDHLELAEILRTRRVLIVEGREDEESLDQLGRRRLDDWDARRKLIRVVQSDGSEQATVSRIQFVNDVLQRILPDPILIAHLRDRDLLSDEGVQRLVDGATERGLSLHISERRNRESFLVSPQVVERAVRAVGGSKIPVEWEDSGTIGIWVAAEIMEWCREELDALPAKVQEYNRHWIRRAFQNDELGAAEQRLNRFIREEWTGPVERAEIPWKLVDGKAVLSRLRRCLQGFSIALPEAALHAVMKEVDYGESLSAVVDLAVEWTE